MNLRQRLNSIVIWKFAFFSSGLIFTEKLFFNGSSVFKRTTYIYIYNYKIYQEENKLDNWKFRIFLLQFCKLAVILWLNLFKILEFDRNTHILAFLKLGFWEKFFLTIEYKKLIEKILYRRVAHKKVQFWNRRR